MNYQLIYKAANSHEAHFIQGLLKRESIKSQLLGENLSLAIGELPIEAMQVDILVPKNNFSKSKKIISNYEKNLSLNKQDNEWKCTKCNKLNPFNFDICWNCNK